MCSRIEQFFTPSNPNFCKDHGKSALIVAIAITFITLSTYGARGRLPIGSIGTHVLSAMGCIALATVFLNYLYTCCHYEERTYR